MDIEFIKKEKQEIEFLVKNEDISFFDLIVKMAGKKKEVEFVAKKGSNHLKKEFTIYLKTKDKLAKNVLLECINEAEDKFNDLLNHLEKASEKIE
jgi:DNA-directed RNA polymerase subunit L